MERPALAPAFWGIEVRSLGTGQTLYERNADKGFRPASTLKLVTTAAALDGIAAWGKTGTSSGGRDAWFVGGAGRLVTAVWLGVAGDRRGGLRGGADAAPVWAELMRRAAPAYPAPPPPRPDVVVDRWLEESSGLLVRRPRPGTRSELYRRGNEPGRRRLLRADVAEAPLE